MAQLVKHPTLDLAQVMILWFVGSSPTLGSALSARNLLEILSLSLSLSLPLTLLLLSLKINKLT